MVYRVSEPELRVRHLLGHAPLPLGVFCEHCKHRALIEQDKLGVRRAICGCCWTYVSNANLVGSEGTVGKLSGYSCSTNKVKHRISCMAKKPASPEAPRRKKARSDDAEVVLKELLRATERAHAGNRKRWVQVGDLDFPYTPTQLHFAIAVAEQQGWLIVGGKPAHSVMMTPQGLKEIV